MIKKIAVLRANALGDFIFVLPALQALKEKFPEAEIVYLGKAWHKGFLENRPGPVSRVVVVPPYPGVGEGEDFKPNEQQLDDFFQEMQNEQFDLAFQLHGGGRFSNPFILKLGAKRTIGLKTPEAADLDISVPYVYYFSEILRYLEVVARVGAKTSAIEPVVSVTADDVAEAQSILGELNGKIAVIHPGASDLRRRWPRSNFAEIADFIAEKGYTVYLTGVEYEREDINEILEKVKRKNQIHNLCESLPLGATVGLFSKTNLIISNDTGPLHLARALKRPTVGIYWCGNIITGLPMSTALNRSLLSFSINCPLCGLSSTKFGKNDPGTCKHNTSFVADVTVEEVKSAIEELLDQEQLESAMSNYESNPEIKLAREEV